MREVAWGPRVAPERPSAAARLAGPPVLPVALVAAS